MGPIRGILARVLDPDTDTEPDDDADADAKCEGAAPGTAAPRPRRYGLAALNVVEAALFIAAAVRVPAERAWLFRGAVLALAALHVVTAVAALLGARWLKRAWLALAWGSLLALAAAAWALGTTAWYLSELFHNLGPVVVGAAVAAFGLVLLMTLPVAAWGLASCRPLRSWRDLLPWTAVAMLGVLSSGYGARGAHAQATVAHNSDLASMLSAALRDAPKAPSRATLADVRAPDCAAPPREANATLLVTFLQKDTEVPSAACLQATTLAELGNALSALVRTRAYAAPLAIDVVTTTQPLGAALPWLAPLTLRPGLDGACYQARCAAPWQLIARDRFMGVGFSIDADARLGVSPSALGADLNAVGDDLAGFTRIETAAFHVGADGALTRRERLRGARPALDQAALAHGTDAARAHVLRALRDDGHFRYSLDPFAGTAQEARLQLPRQAGTTLALCELGGATDEVRGAARRALAFLASLERPIGDARALLLPGQASASLGELALPLAAILSCRRLVGGDFDALAGRLTTLVLHMQQPDGSFASTFTGRPDTSRGGRLYGDGQALLALVLAERFLSEPSRTEGEKRAFPPLAAVRTATTAAMNYVAERYWQHPLRNFFYVEENWHCLAARAALTMHRHDGYERFCLDYVAFKARFILRAGEGGDAALAGGYAPLGLLTVPQTTPTAGFGEALAAAVLLKRARGASTDAELELLREVLAFLVQAQWDAAACVACAASNEAVGGFSRHLASPPIRIDYVQHAWSALGHGGRALGLLEDT